MKFKNPVALGLFSLPIFNGIVRFHDMKGGDFIGEDKEILHEYPWYS